MISKWMLFYVAFRTFFVQALWNFERLQNAGFAFAIMPALKKIYKNDNDGYLNALKRHMDFFNVHPYMVGIILGVVISYEEKMVVEGKDYTHEIQCLKSTMAGPLAALGDSFFWGLWRPLIAVVAIAGFYVIPQHCAHNWCLFLIIFLFLICYNLPHLLLRFWGTFKAYNMGTQVIFYVKKWHDLDVYTYLRGLGTIFISLAFLGFVITNHYPLMTILKIMIVTMFFVALNRRKLSTNKMIFLVVSLVILFANLKVI